MAKPATVAANLIIIFPVPISDSNWISEKGIFEKYYFCTSSCVRKAGGKSFRKKGPARLSNA